MPKEFSLEGHIKQLEAIEAYFQAPDMNIDEAIKKHKEALALAKEALDYLKTAQTTIEKIDIQAALEGDEDSEVEGRN